MVLNYKTIDIAIPRERSREQADIIMEAKNTSKGEPYSSPLLFVGVKSLRTQPICT